MPLWSITTSRITPPEDPSRAIACEIAVGVRGGMVSIDNGDSQYNDVYGDSMADCDSTGDSAED
jgi:hypothetical protein